MSYALLCENKEEIERVSGLVTTRLRKCAKDILDIKARYPDAGIGDTATDEAIMEAFYHMLHSGQNI